MSAENPAECFRLVDDCILADQVYTIGYTADVSLSPAAVRSSLTSEHPEFLRLHKLHHHLSMILLEAGHWDEDRWGGYPSYDGGHNMVVPVGKHITAVYDFPYEPNEAEPHLAAVMLRNEKGICVAEFNRTDEYQDSSSSIAITNARGITLTETTTDIWAGMDELGLHEYFYKAAAEMVINWLKHREDKPEFKLRIPFSDAKTEALYQAVMHGSVDFTDLKISKS